MRILHVAETIKGGVGTYLNHLVPQQCRELGPGGVELVAPAQHMSQIPAVPPTIVRAFDRPSRSPASLLALARATRDSVARFQPDVVHVHSTLAGAVVRPLLAPRSNRPRIVYCPHGWVFDAGSSRPGRSIAARAERALAPLGDAVVAVSAHEARQARRIGHRPERIRVIPNGIPSEITPAPVPSWDDDRLKVLFVGRLDRQKGFDILVEALAGLEDRIVARAIGEAVQRRHRGPVENGSVEHLGWCSEAEIEGHLRQCDVVVMPSRWEAFGLVALEAMRAGRPVLAASVGGLPEIVRDGVTGHLFPPGDAAALRALLLASETVGRRRQGEAGRRRFLAGFTADRVHADLMTLYRDVLGPRAAFAKPDAALSYAADGSPA